MNNIFTPTEAAAIVQIPTKRVYKELEYAIVPSSNPPRLPFEALVYLRALKEVDFTFSVDFRTVLYKRLVDAIAHNSSSLEIARYFILQLDAISNELLELINRFNRWKEGLVTNQAIMGGKQYFLILALLYGILVQCLNVGNQKK